MKTTITLWQNYDVEPDMEYYTEEYGEELANQCAYDWECDMLYEDLTMMRNSIKRADDNNYVVVLGSLGLWNGTVHGYKIVRYSEIFDFSQDCDYAEWTYENGNLTCRQSHHDGTNCYEFRLIRKGVDVDWIDGKLYDSTYGKIELSDKWLDRYTRKLGDKVLVDLGWWTRGQIMKQNRADKKAEQLAECIAA